jgi:hypothetical protein
MSEGFLGRWSRLKRSQPDQLELDEKSLQKPLTVDLDDSDLNEEKITHSSDTYAVDQQKIDEQEPELETLPEDEPASVEESVSVDESAVLTDADMPDLSTINAKSDMSMFWSSGVSAELRRQALRKFFHQPEFNVRDPLDDYALDYSQPKKLVQEVGEKVRGWAQQQMDDAMQQAREALLKTDASNELVVEDLSNEVSDSLNSNESLAKQSLDDSTKVAKTDQDGKNESA